MSEQGIVCNNSGIPLYDRTTGKLIQGFFDPVVKYDNVSQSKTFTKYDDVVQTAAQVMKYDATSQTAATVWKYDSVVQS